MQYTFSLALEHILTLFAVFRNASSQSLQYAFFVQYVYIAPACCDLRYFGSPKVWSAVLQTSVADPHHYDAHPNTDSHPSCDFDADPTFHFDSDPDPNPVPSFQSAQIGFH